MVQATAVVNPTHHQPNSQEQKTRAAHSTKHENTHFFPTKQKKMIARTQRRQDCTSIFTTNTTPESSENRKYYQSFSTGCRPLHGQQCFQPQASSYRLRLPTTTSNHPGSHRTQTSSHLRPCGRPPPSCCFPSPVDSKKNCS